MNPSSSDSRVAGQACVRTGAAGLDDVLHGGLTPHRLYLLEGVPGSGKTTLALQFLLEGVRRGEPVLYVTLSESIEELAEVAASHGWTLDAIAVHELSRHDDTLQPEGQYTMFHPSEVELGNTLQQVLDDVERIRPTRVVFDSLSELRLLAESPLRYRRQILALKQFFAGRRCTVLMLDDKSGREQDVQVQSIVHGVIRLEQLYPEYGAERRRLIVVKCRGASFRGGYHDYVIQYGGLQVYPRLVASEHRMQPTCERVPSDIEALDALLGGGLERGTSTLVVGAAGTGKSTLTAQYVTAAAARGLKSALFVFDEGLHTLLSRCAGLGIDLQRYVDNGQVSIRQIDPAELAPGEFAHAIREAVEQQDAAIVVIDSLNGYLNAMPEERFLIIQLHELLTYLGQAGVATLLVSAQQGLIGSQMAAPVDASYLADAVVLMRYFESQGELRQAISVVKKRGGLHERSIREFRMDHSGISVGPPLSEFRGILTGVPIFEGQADGAR